MADPFGTSAPILDLYSGGFPGSTNPGTNPLSGGTDISLGTPSPGGITGIGPTDSSGSGAAPGGGSSLGGALGAGAAGAGLLYSLFNNNTPQSVTNLQNLQGQVAGEAQSFTQQGQGLESYLTSGGLPPAQAAQVDAAKQAAKARVVQNAATSGLSTDPNQNSALGQDLASADQQGLILQGKFQQELFQAGQQLTAQGVQLTGLDASLLEKLQQIDQTNTDDIGKSIAAFAGALGKVALPALGV